MSSHKFENSVGERSLPITPHHMSNVTSGDTMSIKNTKFKNILGELQSDLGSNSLSLIPYPFFPFAQSDPDRSLCFHFERPA